jgi:ribosomal protein L22
MSDAEKPEIENDPEPGAAGSPAPEADEPAAAAPAEPESAEPESAEPESAEPEAAEPAADAPSTPDEVEEAGALGPEAPAKARRGLRRGKRGGGASAEKPATPAKPAPSRRRAAREPGTPAPVVRAQAKYVRSSPRKARLVCDHIRGKTVEEARAILAHTPRAVARDWSKLLESAVANAEHNHELVGEDLYVKSVTADDGPTIKRFRPRAMGRATKIRKRTTHLTILLTPKE